MKSASTSIFQATPTFQTTPTFRAAVVTACIFGISIPVLMVLLNHFSRPSLLSQASGCATHQVYRVSDQSCYVLQGE
jgi:hypothetical protein